MNDKQKKHFIYGMFGLIAVIAVCMLVFSILHYNRYRLCTMEHWRSLHLCVWPFAG